MKITNNFGLPEAFRRAVENDGYNKGEADFSITELIAPARQRALQKRYDSQLEEDCSSKAFSLFGQSVHHVLERAARPGVDLAEKRFFAPFEVDDEIYTLSGQIDLLSDYKSKAALSDWKTTKLYPFTKKGGLGQKPEWIAQLNMQLELLRINGLDANSLWIVGILRDWGPKNKAEVPREVATVSIPIWPREKTQAFIIERMRAHLNAIKVLPECSKAEVWGGRRCLDYCNVSAWCAQYQQSKQTGLIGGKDENTKA